MNEFDLFAAAAGTVISVPTHIVFRHVGMISDRRGYDGLPFIISNSPRAGGLVEEHLTAFTAGNAWRNVGYLGTLQPWQVLYRARVCQRRDYDALTWNCEHFVNHCHGRPETSGQVVMTLVCAALGMALLSATYA
jgi:hypothetical protein